MLKKRLITFTVMAFVLSGLILSENTAFAQTNSELEAIKAEVRTLKSTYESQIAKLEKKIEELKKTQQKTTQTLATKSDTKRQLSNNNFNPAIGVVLDGKYHYYSSEENEIPGFALGHEAEAGKRGFSLDESELNLSGNVDDKFYGSLTAAIAEHEGETEIELEEAYVQLLPGAGLPNGLTVKFGRAFWSLGYLNEHHSHTDDFADRPLPYRAFLNGVYNDDGAQISYLLPTDLYTEVGGGIFRGDAFPFGSSDGKGITSWSLFARIGGDIGIKQNWLLGGSILSGKAKGDRITNDEALSFSGKTTLYIADFRYVWTPTGNARQQEITLQGEYFKESESGGYQILGSSDTMEAMGSGISGFSAPIHISHIVSGWYVQGVYRFGPQWRVGARYSQLTPANFPGEFSGSLLDTQGYKPKDITFMVDWSNSEFSRIRLQYGYQEWVRGQHKDQITLQYIMSLGAHKAHKY